MDMQASGLEDDSAAKKQAPPKTLSHSLKSTAAGSDYVIDLSSFPTDSKLSMADMDLEVGGGTIVLRSKHGGVVVPLGADDDESNISAKLSQKKRTLTVKVAARREKL
jgi:hypothetical protein